MSDVIMTFQLEEPGATTVQLQVGDPAVELMYSNILADHPPALPDVLDGGTF